MDHWSEAITVLLDQEEGDEDADRTFTYLEPDEVSRLREEGFVEWFNEGPCLEVVFRAIWSIGSEKAYQVYFVTGTGGPAVRIACEPDSNMAWVEVQDWFTAWETIDRVFSPYAQKVISDAAREMIAIDEQSKA